jgi:type II secretory pathway pseudopilin PulG
MVKREAFSLVELLGSIAIIALLAAVLLPVLAQARGQTQQSACASNLRQLGLAALQYAADYDGALPLTSHSGPTAAWATTLRPYGVTPALRLCPADPARSQRLARGGTSYAWNENLLSEWAHSHGSGTSTGVTYKPAPCLEQLTLPTQTLLLVEQSAVSGTDDRGDHIHNRAWKNFPRQLRQMLQSDLALERHPGGSVVVCGDGHLQHFPPGLLEAQAEQGQDPLRVSF